MAAGDIETAFADALEGAETTADSSPESTPAEPETEPSASATADVATETTPPAEPVDGQTDGGQTAADTTDTPPKGEPPQWRWQDILAHARETSTKEGREQALRDLGLGPDANPQQVQQAVQFAQWLDREPDKAITWLQQQVQASAPIEEPEPQPDAAIQTPDGRRVPVFTAEGQQRWRAWHDRRIAAQLEQSFSEKFAPALSVAQQMQQLQRQQQQTQQSMAWAQTVMAPLAKSPYFTEFQPELQKTIANMPETATDDELIAAVTDRFWALHQAKVAGVAQSGESEALARLQQRAVASDVNSGAGVSREPRQYTADEDGFAQALEDLAGTGR